MAWNDAKVTLLRKLWSEGLTEEQITARIDGVTFEAVRSKLKKLGLLKPDTTGASRIRKPRGSTSHKARSAP
jgi:GcrA cell cycle regulator